MILNWPCRSMAMLPTPLWPSYEDKKDKSMKIASSFQFRTEFISELMWRVNKQWIKLIKPTEFVCYRYLLLCALNRIGGHTSSSYYFIISYFPNRVTWRRRWANQTAQPNPIVAIVANLLALNTTQQPNFWSNCEPFKFTWKSITH